jgi:hypothetical protein
MKALSDTKAPDGLVARGERWVRPPGRVKFAHVWWADDRLKPFVGQQIMVSAGDYHYGSVLIEPFRQTAFEIKAKAESTERGKT